MPCHTKTKKMPNTVLLLHVLSVTIYLAIIMAVFKYVYPQVTQVFWLTFALTVSLILLCNWASHKYTMDLARAVEVIVASFILTYVLYYLLQLSTITNVSETFILFVFVGAAVLFPFEFAYKTLGIK